MEVEKIYKIYEFQNYPLNQIELDFGKFKKYSVGKFLSLLYKRSIYFKNIDNRNDSLNNKGFVYCSKMDLERFLGYKKYEDGKYEWEKIINRLSHSGLVYYRRDGNNKFNFNYKFWLFKLSDEFFDANKSWVEIEDYKLNRYLSKKNENYLNKFVSVKDGNTKGKDKIVLYEMEVCKLTDIQIPNLEVVINNRVNNKIDEFEDKLKWGWKSDKQLKEIKIKLDGLKSDSSEYKQILRNKYELLIDDIECLKNNDFTSMSSDDYFKRDTFGLRIYNLYSNVIREYRTHIKIEGEDVVELDLKNSMVCCFYWMIQLLLDDSFNTKNYRLKNIKHKLLKYYKDNNLDSNRLEVSYSFIERFNMILNDTNKINGDYYTFLMEEFNSSSIQQINSRNSFKDLLWLLLFGNEKQNSNTKLNDITYNELRSLMLGFSRDLVVDIKNLDLYKLSQNKRNYKRYKNISETLHLLERGIMDVMSIILMNNGYKFISIFDGFIIKKSEGEKIQNLLNNNLSSINKVFRLTLK